MEGSPALICIPDITGFTEFMSEAKLESSKKIIPSLLNKIIYANNIGLKVSEIEGDAVLFFKMGDLPPLNEIVAQCKQFFDEFHLNIEELAKKHKGDKDFTDLTDKLGLKIVMHYGLVEMVKVGTRLKLIGEDVIVAHRLLKNEIKFSEYMVITNLMMHGYPEADPLRIKIEEAGRQGSDQYDHLGDLSYYYLSTDQLNKLSY